MFSPGANSIYRGIILGFVVLVFALIGVGMAYVRSPWRTEEGRFVQQAVPFSHEHHVGQLKIDCRYCHDSVEISSFAGIPATDVCMSCHSQVWTNAEMLEPVRDSLRNSLPLRWNRVYDLPDYVYFDHSIHLAKGVGCETCHGRVDRMPLTAQAASLSMMWCLDCHRDPQPHIRPRSQLFTLGYESDQEESAALMKLYHVEPSTDCYTCHR